MTVAFHSSTVQTMPLAWMSIGAVSTLAPEDVIEYKGLSPSVKKLLDEGLALTRENLSYKYGSADPQQGGMDCSGTIYYLLQQAGISDAPRDSSEQYKWVWLKSRFRAVVSPNPETFELSELKPGDLLFWTGTYDINRDPPVTHVMIYLGTNRLTGHRVMLGASDGRTFNGSPCYGVSVFDFKLPRAVTKSSSGSAGTNTSEGGSRFIGYGSIPGLDQARGQTADSHSSLSPKG